MLFWKLVKKIPFLVLGSLNLYLLYQMEIWKYLNGQLPLWDFDIYYQTFLDVWAGSNPYQVPYMQTAGPPLVILPYGLFVWLPLAAARIAVAVCNLVSLWLSCWLLAPRLHTYFRFEVTLLLTAVGLLLFPIRFNFDVGQLNLVGMLLATAWLLADNRWVRTLSLISVAVFKTHYLILGFSLLRRRPWEAKVAIIGLLCLFGLSLGLFRSSAYTTFLQERATGIVLAASPTIDLDYYNQSLRATLARFQLGSWYQIIWLLLVVVGSGYLWLTGDRYAAIPLAIGISPVVWQHYLPVLYPVLILMWQKYREHGQTPLSFWIAGGLLTIHLPWLHHTPLSLASAWAASHFWLGNLLLIGTWWWFRFKLYKLGKT